MYVLNMYEILEVFIFCDHKALDIKNILELLLYLLFVHLNKTT